MGKIISFYYIYSSFECFRIGPNSEALEGRVYVVEGDYFAQKDLRKDLQERRINEVGDVYALDLLHIIPPKMQPSDFDHGLPEELIWNGVDKKGRKIKLYFSSFFIYPIPNKFFW